MKIYMEDMKVVIEQKNDKIDFEMIMFQAQLN